MTITTAKTLQKSKHSFCIPAHIRRWLRAGKSGLGGTTLTLRSSEASRERRLKTNWNCYVLMSATLVRLLLRVCWRFTVSNGGVYLNSLGIGAIAGANRLSVGGGSSNFGGNVSFQASTTFNHEILGNSRGRIYQQGNANFSLNFIIISIISTNEQNFSIQSNRNADPQASKIFLQLNDTAGITLNKAYHLQWNG